MQTKGQRPLRRAARWLGAQKLALVQSLRTQTTARTIALDPRTHQIYLSAATLAPTPKAAAGAACHRPTTVPGSFNLLVYGPANGGGV